MQILRTDYTFDASEQTITFTDDIEHENLITITNVTSRVVIYNNVGRGGGTFISSKVLKLGHDTTNMSDSDELQIYYEDPTARQWTLSTPYTYQIAEGEIVGHTSWSKIGYSPTINTSESDIWSAAGVYAFATAEGKWEVVSSDNTQDIGTIIKTGTSDAGGSATTLVDAAVDFTTATAVAVGDCVILDKSGTSPEWGYVTGIAAHTLTIAGGFSSGGTGTNRAYSVVDKSAYTGAQAVRITYLDDDYAEHQEIVILNGTTAVDTVNTNFFRVNSFRVIATGTGGNTVGNLSLRADGGSPTYSYILVGYTRARNIQYTVPAGKTLYVTQFTMSFGSVNANTYCRLYTRANIDNATGFHTGSLFYPYSEVIVGGGSTVSVELVTPTRLPEKTDIKVSGIASNTGVAFVALRGWIEVEE
jgi:hypothetical protein